MVSGVPANNRAKPVAHCGDGIMHAPGELDIHFDAALASDSAWLGADVGRYFAFV